jgi:hypothetical protein
MTAPNFKVEAHKAVERILSIPSRTERDRVLADLLKDMFERGQVSKVAAIGREAPASPIARETIRALDGLKDLKATVNTLLSDLKAV